MNRVRIAISMLMILLVSCKEAGKYEKSERIEPKWAGQYILNDSREDSRLQSLRYILSPDGSAERHLLRKSNRWADFRLEEILRGQWSSGEQSIKVRLKDGKEILTETFDSIKIQINPRDTSRIDTFWIDTTRPEKSLKRIATF